MNILIKRFSGLFKEVVSGFGRAVFKGMIRPLIHSEGGGEVFPEKGRAPMKLKHSTPNFQLLYSGFQRVSAN